MSAPAFQIVVRTVDGAIFRGGSAAAVVRQMKRTNWSAPSRKVEYMEEVAERVWSMKRAVVRTDPASFLLDLRGAELLEIRVRTELDLDTVQGMWNEHQVDGHPDAVGLFRAALTELGIVA
jgi:hypothetical protein